MTRSTLWRKRLVLLSGILLIAAGVNAACPSMPTIARFEMNMDSDGAAIVTDKTTGLIWKRCAEGQYWSQLKSVCVGYALPYFHEQALARASAEASATGKPWRLPNVKELFSLSDHGCADPAIDLTAFPGAPADYFWSSTPSLGDKYGAWTVYFSAGASGYYFRNLASAVRLVRDSP